MDKLEQIVANFLSSKFDEWKPYLNTDEQAVFILYYFKGYKTFQIAMELNYSERLIFRIFKSAR